MKKNTKRNFQTFVGVFIGFGFMFSINAYASDQNPCSKEMAMYCKNLTPGTSAMMDCLEKHENKLSNACKDYEAKMGGSRVEMRENVRNISELRQACKDDTTKFCKDVNPEQDGITTCLKKHENKLSAMCRKSIQEKKKEEKNP